MQSSNLLFKSAKAIQILLITNTCQNSIKTIKNTSYSPLIMERTLIKDLKTKLNQEVLLQGWVQEFRNVSKIKFIILRDRTGDIQTVAFKGETPEIPFNLANEITRESVVEIIGIAVESKESRWGLEVKVKDLKIISKAQTPLPIDNSDKSLTHIEKRLDNRFLDTRNSKVGSIFKVRSKIVKIVTNFFDENGFTNINSPKMTALGVESGADCFRVDYFGKPMFLAQSPQVYKQMFVVGGFERVYEIGAVFRAEKSHTTRHLTEFTGVDFEMGFINNHHDVMDFIESMFNDLLHKLPTEAAKELSTLGVTLPAMVKIPRMSVHDAKQLLIPLGKKYLENEDLDAEGERMLGEIVKEKYGSEFVFVTEFPWAIKPFYQTKDEKNPHVTKSFDLLYNGVEICSGSQREHRYNIWAAQAQEKGLDPEQMREYGDLFKFGAPKHGGAGFGLDRITHRLLKLDNIREAVLLPRDPERMKP